MGRSAWKWSAIFALMVTVLALKGASRAEEMPAAQVAKVYASPGEVFTAYKTAHEKRDWRSFFLCHDSQAQREAVFGAVVGCCLKGTPELREVMKKFGLDDAALEKEYSRRHEKKHGVDFAKAIADYKTAAHLAVDPPQPQLVPKPMDKNGTEVTPAPPVQPQLEMPVADGELVREVTASLVTDKVGFYSSVRNLVDAEPARLPTYGPLEQLHIKGDTATGRVTWTVLINDESEPTRTMNLVINFRKENGGWLIDGEATAP